MKEKINKLGTTQNASLILRHAERYEIKKSEFGNDVLLNENGIKGSYEFGKKMSEYDISKIYTSPIQRCVQTAENIVRGYGKQIQIVKTKMLGDPGIHVSDEDKLGEYYFKHGFWKIFDNFKNNKNVPGLKSKEQLLLEFNRFISETRNDTGLTLYITHDWLIAFYAYAANIFEYTVENWINYLNGLIINKQGYGKRF